MKDKFTNQCKNQNETVCSVFLLKLAWVCLSLASCLFTFICLHKKDFDVEAEWEFFATSHGKSACDGLGGTIKRLATKASLQRPYDNQILTPKQLYEFAKKNIRNINFEYSTVEDYETAKKYLHPRLTEAEAIVGTQKFHSFLPVAENQIIAKTYHYSQESSLIQIRIIYEKTPSELDNVASGFVTVAYDNSWWLGYIEGEENDLLKINFLHPKGPARSFFYPEPRDVSNVPFEYNYTKSGPIYSNGENVGIH